MKTDEQLVSLYRKGNSNAFDELYDRYKNLVKFYARNLFLLGAENDDLLQEGMLGFFKAVTAYKEGESSFKTYATLCIKASLNTAVKRYSNNKSKPLNTSAPFEMLDNLGFISITPEQSAIIKESNSELKNKIFSMLSKNEVIVLEYYLQGLSYQEIANKTEKTVKSVENSLARARKKIMSLGA